MPSLYFLELLDGGTNNSVWDWLRLQRKLISHNHSLSKYNFREARLRKCKYDAWFRWANNRFRLVGNLPVLRSLCDEPQHHRWWLGRSTFLSKWNSSFLSDIQFIWIFFQWNSWTVLFLPLDHSSRWFSLCATIKVLPLCNMWRVNNGPHKFWCEPNIVRNNKWNKLAFV